MQKTELNIMNCWFYHGFGAVGNNPQHRRIDPVWWSYQPLLITYLLVRWVAKGTPRLQRNVYLTTQYVPIIEFQMCFEVHGWILLPQKSMQIRKYFKNVLCNFFQLLKLPSFTSYQYFFVCLRSISIKIK